MILCAHELVNGDVVQKPGALSAGQGSWHTINKVKQTPECVRFSIAGKGYALHRDYGVRVKR